MEINKVICGDSLEYMKTLPDKCIDLILTDPPYGMSYKSNWREGKSRIKHQAIENDDNLDWLYDYIKEIGRVVKNDGHLYIFCSHHKIDKFLLTIKKYLPYKNILIWNKTISGMGDLEGDYGTMTEFIIYCSNGIKKLNGNRDSNIIKYTRTQNELHPTEKPVSLFSYLIEKSTKPGDIVLDCFAGSGTTAIACIETGRNYIVIEKEPKYCEIINNRIKSTTLPLFVM